MTGSTVPHRRSTLMPRIPGTILKVNVNAGDRVKTGEVLAVFDTRDVRLRIQAANAAIGAARVAVSSARTEAHRAAKLLATRSLPEQQRDLARARYDGARAQLKQALVAKEMAQVALDDSEVKAPYDCVVVMRHVNEGEYATTMPPSPLFTVEETGTLDVHIDVPAAQLREVRVGTALSIRVPATGETLKAPVTRVVPSVNPRSRTATAIVVLTDPPAGLIPGLFIEANVAGADAARPELVTAPSTERPAAPSSVSGEERP